MAYNENGETQYLCTTIQQGAETHTVVRINASTVQGLNERIEQDSRQNEEKRNSGLEFANRLYAR